MANPPRFGKPFHPQYRPGLTGPTGRPLCKYCVAECPRGRRTFCGERCVYEWKIRSNVNDLRKAVYERDHGICAECRIDTELFRRQCNDLAREQAVRNFKAGLEGVITPIIEGYRVDVVARINAARKHDMNRYLEDQQDGSECIWIDRDGLDGQPYSPFEARLLAEEILRVNRFDPDRSLWEAEHIIPVCEGGGMCGIENIKTLCQACHKAATKALRARLKGRPST